MLHKNVSLLYELFSNKLSDYRSEEIKFMLSTTILCSMLLVFFFFFFFRKNNVEFYLFYPSVLDLGLAHKYK